MNSGSSVLHIVVEPATNCCRYVGVEDTIEQLLMVQLSNAAVRSSATSTVRCAGFFLEKLAAISAVIVDSAVHVVCFGNMPC